jgi:osmotically-inducible protein OsmY
VKSNSQIREEVIQELQWNPEVTDPDAIGVAVKDGAVTLTGSAPGIASVESHLVVIP